MYAAKCASCAKQRVGVGPLTTKDWCWTMIDAVSAAKCVIYLMQTPRYFHHKFISTILHQARSHLSVQEITCTDIDDAFVLICAIEHMKHVVANIYS